MMVELLFRRKCPEILPPNFESQLVVDAMQKAMTLLGESPLGVRSGQTARYIVAFGPEQLYDDDGVPLKRRVMYHWVRIETPAFVRDIPAHLKRGLDGAITAIDI